MGLVDIFQRGFGGADDVLRDARFKDDEPWLGVENIECTAGRVAEGDMALRCIGDVVRGAGGGIDDNCFNVFFSLSFSFRFGVRNPEAIREASFRNGDSDWLNVDTERDSEVDIDVD